MQGLVCKCGAFAIVSINLLRASGLQFRRAQIRLDLRQHPRDGMHHGAGTAARPK